MNQQIPLLENGAWCPGSIVLIVATTAQVGVVTVHHALWHQNKLRENGGMPLNDMFLEKQRLADMPLHV
jgi:hypothetical protein